MFSGGQRKGPLGINGLRIWGKMKNTEMAMTKKIALNFSYFEVFGYDLR